MIYYGEEDNECGDIDRDLWDEKKRYRIGSKSFEIWVGEKI